MPNPIINRRVLANSARGPTSNGLLNGLISYWKFDDDEPAGANTIDSVGSNPLTLAANTVTGGNFCGAGIINGALCLGVGSSAASHVSNSDFLPAAGVSLSISFWATSTDWGGGTGSFPTFMNKGDNATLNSYNALIVRSSGAMAITLEDSSSTQVAVGLTAGLPTGNVYHHVVLVFDAAAKTLTGYYDGVNKGSVPTNTNQIISGAQNFYFGPGPGFAAINGLKVDEAGLWHIALNQAKVTSLYNSGAALSLSQFQI